MVPFYYIGPSGHNPIAGALYPGRRFYPNDLPSDLVIEWIDKGWLVDDRQPGEQDSALVHVENNGGPTARPKRKG